MSEPTLSKATITIRDDGKRILFEVACDPPHTGTQDQWHMPAKIADMIMDRMAQDMASMGLQPAIEVKQSAITGEKFITTRTDNKGPNENNQRST
jgi:hypothetical protein